jgi:single-strand DNA-binding protein
MHIVHGELRKAPYIKQGCGQDGQSTMFIIELSEMIKDRQTGEKLYTNYSAMIFAKSPAQVDYYTTSLVEGNYIVINCEKLKVDVSDHNGKQYIKLQMENARLEGAKYIESNQGGFQQQQAPQQQPQQQQQYQQQPQQQGQLPPNQNGFGQPRQQQPQQQQSVGGGGFDDTIPF